MTDFELGADDVELRIHNFVRALNPRQLLVNVCGPQFERPERREFRVGLGGGYTEKYGQTHDEAPAWPKLQGRLEQDSRMQAALAEARELGLHGRFGGDAEHNMHVFQCIFDVAEDACARIRKRAFQDKVLFPGDESVWQQRFDLYLKQEWTRDDAERERYRKDFDLVAWPSPPRELWPLRRLE
jgi:hypothetical protein